MKNAKNMKNDKSLINLLLEIHFNSIKKKKTLNPSSNKNGGHFVFQLILYKHNS